jgi:diadenosine tetraphosphate (Ap4A) HIT family hydrolase
MTTNRFWDPKNQYTTGILKDYKHWELAVNYRQHTLGSYIVLIKQPGIEKFSELNDEQTLELRQVFLEIETALLTNPTFRPDRFNYLQLGNAVHMLHYHGIPRYESSRQFAEKEWIDPTPGHPPVWKNDEEDHELIAKLRDEIMKDLP